MRLRHGHKFRAKPVNDDGHNFSSTLEFAYFNHLKLLKRSGELLFSLRQVPFHLPGGVKYVCDYQEFYADGNVRFVDVKGVETSEFIMKKKMVEAIYPVTIEVVKKGSF